MDKHESSLTEKSLETPSERDAQRALDAASSEPRTLSPEEQRDTATKLDQQATADRTTGHRTDPREDRATG
jgi:hypothetical protein